MIKSNEYLKTLDTHNKDRANGQNTRVNSINSNARSRLAVVARQKQNKADDDTTRKYGYTPS